MKNKYLVLLLIERLIKISELDSIIKGLSKDFNMRVTTGAEFPDVDKIEFSSPRLNYMTYGGLPMGRPYEFFGKPSSGKTTTALDLMGKYQKQIPNKSSVYVDIERTFDKHWATMLGVDVEKMLYLCPEIAIADDVLEAVYRLACSGEVGFIIIDSIATLLTEKEQEEQVGQKVFGGISIPVTSFMRKVVGPCIQNNCTIIIINQVREDLGAMYGSKIKTPGGNALEHLVSARLQFNKGEYLDINGKTLAGTAENPAGNRVNVNIMKTKVFPPDRKKGFYSLYYQSGIDQIGDLIDVAISKGVVIAGGAWYTYNEIKYQGKSKLRDYLMDNNEAFIQLKKEVENL